MAGYHIIGDKDTVLGFRFAGVSGTVVSDQASAENAFKAALENPAVSILIITESVQEWLDAAVIEHKASAKPPFIATVEDIWGPRGHRRTMQEEIFEAVGVRIVDEH